MKTKNSKIKALLLLLSLISGILFIFSIVLQTSFIEMEHYIIDLATKHYFILGISSFFIFTICFALFRAFDVEITKREIRNNNRH
jgi:hypothetical protein